MTHISKLFIIWKVLAIGALVPVLMLASCFSSLFHRNSGAKTLAALKAMDKTTTAGVTHSEYSSALSNVNTAYASEEDDLKAGDGAMYRDIDGAVHWYNRAGQDWSMNEENFPGSVGPLVQQDWSNARSNLRNAIKRTE